MTAKTRNGITEGYQPLYETWALFIFQWTAKTRTRNEDRTCAKSKLVRNVEIDTSFCHVTLLDTKLLAHLKRLHFVIMCSIITCSSLDGDSYTIFFDVSSI